MKELFPKLSTKAEREPTIQDRFRDFVRKHEWPNPEYRILNVADAFINIDFINVRELWFEDEPQPAAHILSLNSSRPLPDEVQEVLELWVHADDSFSYRYARQPDLEPLTDPVFLTHVLDKLDSLEREGNLQPHTSII